MLDVLGEEKGVLFYNVFGLVEIFEDRIKVYVHFSKDGKNQTRTMVFESNDLQNIQRPLNYSFGAWIAGQDDHYVVFEERTSYDQAVFESNKEFITAKVHLVLEDAVGKISM